jgi:hypothetical protein
MKAQGVSKHTIEGTAGGMKAVCYLSLVEYNFLANWSFEDGETGWTANAIKTCDQLYVEDKVTDSLTGTWHMHFWSAAQNSVEFTLEQKVQDLPGGKYKFTISIMGGDAGEMDVYAYIKIDGQIVKKEVAAVHRRRARDLAAVVGLMAKRLVDKLLDFGGHDLVLRVGDEVKPGQAPHRTPVDDTILDRRRPEIGRDDMLDRVHRIGMDGRLDIGALHADVEGGDVAAVDAVAAAYVDAWNDLGVIDLE